MKPKPRRSPQREHVISHPLGTHPASKALSERFASAILTGKRRELNQILCEVAKISNPSDSPERYFGVMACLLVRTARQAVRQCMAQEGSRNLALTDDPRGPCHRRRPKIKK
jgi:hypothetical protein